MKKAVAKVHTTLVLNRKRNLMRIIRQKFGAGVLPTPSQLIVALELKDNQSAYTFDFVKGTKEFEAIEQILQERDAFVADKVGMALVTCEVGDLGASVMHTYPNPFVFGTQAPDLELVYGGKVETTVNKAKVLDKYPVRLLRYVPETQKVSTATTDGGRIEDAFQDIEPYLIINGRNNCKAILTLPQRTTPNIEGTAPVKNFVIFILDGMIIDGGADILKQKSDAKPKRTAKAK